ncbi:hypothetical protein OH76DRAFT_525200 [Lentinus brumalis]|uniref:Uncharacterized protein n=1 Tax=Lentinus brumalis TaxID=2498619 RepID=A0A371CHQ9_9APHY|nr:hypothetical protein OH76DRAFT_525200 [Polyporus brumalis]
MRHVRVAPSQSGPPKGLHLAPPTTVACSRRVSGPRHVVERCPDIPIHLDAIRRGRKIGQDGRFHHSRTVRHSAPPFALPNPSAPPVVVLLGRSLTCANPTGYIQSSSAPVNPPGRRRLALGPALAVSVISPGRILPARSHFAPRQRWPFGVERPLSRANPTRSPKKFPCVCAVARLVTAIPPLPCLGLPHNGDGVRRRLSTLYPAGPQLPRATSENRHLGRLIQTRRPGDSMPAV